MITINDIIKHISIAENAAWGTGDGKPEYLFKTNDHTLKVTGTVIESSYESFRPAFSFMEDDKFLYKEDSKNIGPYRNTTIQSGIYKDFKTLVEYLRTKYAEAAFSEI